MLVRTIGLAAVIALGAAGAGPAALAADDKVSDPVSKTKMGNLPYAKAPETIGDPTGTKLTGEQIKAKFKGRRTVFVGPQEQGVMKYDADTVAFDRATGAATTGKWRVKDDMYCVTWTGAAENCYFVYQDSDNSYSMWTKQHGVAGRVSIHDLRTVR